jgi:ligand-binding SRPBCC domain-containing protein
VYYELTDHFEVAADVARCWDFFGRAENLPLITPPWLAFTIAMPEPLPEIGQDSVLDYAIRWVGVPVRWKTRIIDWSPPRQFIDLQVRGPYALWHHQHTFTRVPDADGGGGVRCFDRVIYKLPLGPIGRMTHGAVVRRQLIEIFDFRRRIIGQHLGLTRALQDRPMIRAT